MLVGLQLNHVKKCDWWKWQNGYDDGDNGYRKNANGYYERQDDAWGQQMKNIWCYCLTQFIVSILRLLQHTLYPEESCMQSQGEKPYVYELL